jgi:hypothetical protein
VTVILCDHGFANLGELPRRRHNAAIVAATRSRRGYRELLIAPSVCKNGSIG